MNFKTWLNAETVMGSDGVRDNQSVQTQQAGDQAAKQILASPSFAPIQSKLMGSNGSPSAQQKQLVDFTTKGFKNIVSPQIAPLTSPPNVAFNIQNSLGLKTNMKQPQFMKRMSK